MSTQGETLHHPINGASEQTWDGFSWPALCFGAIWLLAKGLYGHFVIGLVLLIITLGFAAPVLWLVCGFVGNDIHRSSLLKQGYLTRDQWEKKNRPAAEEIYAANVRECPFCAEKIKLQARICRFCQRDLPALSAANKSPGGLSIDTSSESGCIETLSSLGYRVDHPRENKWEITFPEQGTHYAYSIDQLRAYIEKVVREYAKREASQEAPPK